MSIASPSPDAVAAADRRFFDALLAADRAALDELLAPEFLIVDVAAGGVTARTQFMDFVGDRVVRFTRIESFPDDTVVRLFGTTAIVVGRTSMEFTAPDGTPVTAASRYTHVFVAAADTLLLASAQGTAIPTT